jgi:hypothetical protein
VIAMPGESPRCRQTLSVIVVRPRAQAEDWVAALRALGVARGRCR